MSAIRCFGRGDLAQHPVYKAAGFFTGEGLGELDRLVDGRLDGDVVGYRDLV